MRLKCDLAEVLESLAVENWSCPRGGARLKIEWRERVRERATVTSVSPRSWLNNNKGIYS